MDAIGGSVFYATLYIVGEHLQVVMWKRIPQWKPSFRWWGGSLGQVVPVFVIMDAVFLGWGRREQELAAEADGQTGQGEVVV